MTSHLSYFKYCEHCSEYFEAKTLYTRYCSHSCNRKHYKKLVREKKVEAFKNTVNKKEKDEGNLQLVELQNKVYLNISEAALFIGVSKRTIERLIARLKLPVSRFNRRVLIKRIDLENYM
ncbi:helix-turn-helix domain-containing protein [Aquirufa beregesia]